MIHPDLTKLPCAVAALPPPVESSPHSEKRLQIAFRKLAYFRQHDGVLSHYRRLFSLVRNARAFPAWQGSTSSQAYFASSQGARSLPGNSPAPQGAALVRHVPEAFRPLVTGGHCEDQRVDGAVHEPRKCRFTDSDVRQVGGNHRLRKFLLESFGTR